MILKERAVKDDRHRGRETERERRARILDEVLADIRKTHPGFRVADNVSREELHERKPAR